MLVIVFFERLETVAHVPNTRLKLRYKHNGYESGTLTRKKRENERNPKTSKLLENNTKPYTKNPTPPEHTDKSRKE
jgi:hypothetical protein